MQWLAATNENDHRAMRELGRLYNRSSEAYRNVVEAHKWLDLAANLSNTDAAAERDTLADVMTQAQISQARALASSWRAQPAGQIVQDCNECPELIVLPVGSYKMGSMPDGGRRRDGVERPVHDVIIDKPIAVGRYEVTFSEWDACRLAGGCSHNPHDEGWGRGDRPVMNVSWNDAQDYVRWLSTRTGKEYRLLSESEWEYAARGETSTAMSQDRREDFLLAAPRESTSPVGSSSPNRFGLHNMLGNVKEWLDDCWHENYVGAPGNGSSWIEDGDCSIRVFRGGSWLGGVHLEYRHGFVVETRRDNIGFRVARSLD